MSAAPVFLSRDELLQAYERMALIRAFEEKPAELFLANRSPGFVHLYAGEEAMAAGVVAAGINLSVFLYALDIWGRLPARYEALQILLLLAAFAAALVLLAPVWTGGRGYVVHGRNPRFVVEEPAGGGWAIHLGHPLGWLVAALFVPVPALPLLLVIVRGR